MTVALALAVLGCQGFLASPEPTYMLAADIIHTQCGVSTTIVGLIVVDESGRLAIRDDRGVTTPLLCSVHGGEVPMLGRRYSIGGQMAEWAGDALWACAGAEHVVPQ